MPMIQSKIAGSVPQEKREALKAELGKAISILGKPESYLMLSIEDGQDLYFAGKKLDKGAYVEVKLLGGVDSSASQKMTQKICEIFDRLLGVPGSSIYVSYWGTQNWGHDGYNF